MVNNPELCPTQQAAGDMADFIFGYGARQWRIFARHFFNLLLDQIEIRLNDPRVFRAFLKDLYNEIGTRLMP